MKVCQSCGTEIFTQDGENHCGTCQTKKNKSAKARQRRKEIDAAMRSMGLVKVKGAMGGTYWE